MNTPAQRSEVETEIRKLRRAAGVSTRKSRAAKRKAAVAKAQHKKARKLAKQTRKAAKLAAKEAAAAKKALARALKLLHALKKRGTSKKKSRPERLNGGAESVGTAKTDKAKHLRARPTPAVGESPAPESTVDTPVPAPVPSAPSAAPETGEPFRSFSAGV